MWMTTQHTLLNGKIKGLLNVTSTATKRTQYSYCYCCVHTKYYIIFLCSRNLCPYNHNIW